jgi:hypothetical protein
MLTAVLANDTSCSMWPIAQYTNASGSSLQLVQSSVSRFPRVKAGRQTWCEMGHRNGRGVSEARWWSRSTSSRVLSSRWEQSRSRHQRREIQGRLFHLQPKRVVSRTPRFVLASSMMYVCNHHWTPVTYLRYNTSPCRSPLSDTRSCSAISSLMAVWKACQGRHRRRPSMNNGTLLIQQV